MGRVARRSATTTTRCASRLREVNKLHRSARCRVPRLRQRRRLPLRISRPAQPQDRQHRRGTDPVLGRRAGRRRGGRRRSNRTARNSSTTSTPIAEIGTAQTPLTLKTRRAGTHIAIHEAALVDYSGMNVAKVARRAAEGGADAVVERPQGQPRRALPDAVARAADRARRARPLHGQFADPQPQRAQQAGRRVVGPPAQICRHLVGHAPRHAELDFGAEARRDHRQRR